ncbi:glycosyltransferase family 41 protein [Polaromonas sp.]|uniref:O-linked N-acetylglucosamine transferase family protein n=1 Tax=Polaromonas sp. TaxID=1869339 RepID=UPI002731BF48|nr:glycosyltransferase family 41 protein [Polaromonas sp.]MDP1741485.1 hypothetical protein [Polaromonas sp.]
MTSPPPLQAHALPPSFALQMAQGSTAHAAGDRAAALTAFQSAVALAPENVHAACACAALLHELDRPQAALRLLRRVEALLLGDPEGATNLAVAAAACGLLPDAQHYLDRALSLQADHWYALAQHSVIAQRLGNWPTAIEYAKQWVAATPERADACLHLLDCLLGARQADQALVHMGEALQRFPDDPQIACRQVMALALHGDFEAAAQALAGLNPAASAAWRQFLGSAASHNTDVHGQNGPDARSLFLRQTFEAMDEGDWRSAPRAAALLRQLSAGPTHGGRTAELHLAMYYGLALGLTEEETQRLGQLAWSGLAADQRPALPAFSVKPSFRVNDSRIHVGLAVHSLHDQAATLNLAARLALHDATRFAFHLYSPTPQPQAVLAEPLMAHSVVEIAHFSDDEAAQRIRLDRLDLWIDSTFGTPWWRPNIALRRVAPVQVQLLPWQGHVPGGPFDYALSDRIIHAGAQPGSTSSALVRPPYTCWMDGFIRALPGPVLHRRGLGLPDSAPVLCAFVPALHIDPDTLDLWLQLLLDQPDAVLWLPAFAAATRQHLQAAAQLQGVDPARLVFVSAQSAHPSSALLPLADLFLDPLRICGGRYLAQALHSGLPAVSCAGQHGAMRLGVSMLHAAGLSEGVTHDRASYLATALALLRDPPRLTALRAQLQAAQNTAPLFDLQARLSDCEAAWTAMVDRARAGLPPCRLELDPD